MKILQRAFLPLSFLCIVKLLAQQDPHYTQYMFNTMSVNPAYAGIKGHPVVNVLGRTQWVGFDGAPNTQNLSFDMPLVIGHSLLGVGLNLVNDKIGLSHEIYVDATMSYTVETGYEGVLSFGLRLGGRMLNID